MRVCVSNVTYCASMLHNNRWKKPETETGDRLDEDRLPRVVFQSQPQPSNRAVQALIEVNEGIRAPQACAQRLACHYLARSFQQGEEHLVRLLLNGQPRLILQQKMRARIDGERCKTVDSLRHDGALLLRC